MSLAVLKAAYKSLAQVKGSKKKSELLSVCIKADIPTHSKT